MFVGLPVCWSVSRLVGCFRVGWLVCPSVEWVVWLVGSLFVYWLVGWFGCLFLGSSIGLLLDWLVVYWFVGVLSAMLHENYMTYFHKLGGWVLAQKRPTELLVQIAIKGQYQEAFLSFFSIVRCCEACYCFFFGLFFFIYFYFFVIFINFSGNNVWMLMKKNRCVFVVAPCWSYALYSVPFWFCHDFLGHNIQPPTVWPKRENSLPSPPTYIFLPGFKASSSMHHLSTTARPAILRELNKNGMV